MTPTLLPIWSWVVIALAAVVTITVVIVLRLRRAGALFDVDEAESQADSHASTLVAMISLAEIGRIYQEHKAAYDARVRDVDNRLADLSARVWERSGPHAVLAQALPQEIDGLRTILGAGTDAQKSALVDSIRKAGSNTTASGTRRLLGRNPHVSFRTVLEDVAHKLGVEKQATAGATDWAIEQVAVDTALKTTLENMSPAQRQELLDKLAAHDRRAKGSIGAATALMTGAHLSGFGVYIGASTLLGSLTSAVGIALPFAAYTGMSSVIATVIGPAGWLGLLGLAAWKVGGVDYKVTTAAVLSIAMIRGRLIGERDSEIADLESERSGQLKNAADQLAKLQELQQHMQDNGIPSVRRDSVPL